MMDSKNKKMIEFLRTCNQSKLKYYVSSSLFGIATIDPELTCTKFMFGYHSITISNIN